MRELKQELLLHGVSPELLAGWEQHQSQYSQPILWPGLLDEAERLVPMEQDAWAAVRDVCQRCMEHEPYGRVLWQLHLLLLGGQGCPGFSTGMWGTLKEYFGDDYPCLGAALFISWIPGMKSLYERMGIGEDVLKATLFDLAIWMRDYRRKQGHWGVTEMSWLVLHPAGRLFRLGRLQFMPGLCPWNVRLYRDGATARMLCGGGEKFRADGQADGLNGVFDPSAWTAELIEDGETVSGNPISPLGSAERRTVTLDKHRWRLVCAEGMPVTEIHIPEDGKLDMEECGKSLGMAVDFIRRHFPEHGKVFQLFTWLLDAQLDCILPPSSNIVQFQRQFYLFPVASNDEQTLDRVFGSPAIDPATAPRDTSLRRAILDHMAKGNRMMEGAGFLLFEDVERWGECVYRN